MRFATLDATGQPRPVVASPDEKAFCAVATLLPGFEGDRVDLIGKAPKLPHVTEWTPLEGHAVLAPIPQPRRNVFDQHR